jgi:hypothetical protein
LVVKLSLGRAADLFQRGLVHHRLQSNRCKPSREWVVISEGNEHALERVLDEAFAYAGENSLGEENISRFK